VLALEFDLTDDKEKAAKELNLLVKNNETRITTGFVGTPYLLGALSDNGYEKTAFDLLFQEAYPSWLFSVNKGATTMWEHWDGIKEDGSFWSTDMNSYNHYAYGSVFEWIFSFVGGISTRQDGPGYRRVNIVPHTDRRLGFVKTGIITRHGNLSSHWYYSGEKIHFEFEIPEKTTAYVSLPGGQTKTLCGGNYKFTIKV